MINVAFAMALNSHMSRASAASRPSGWARSNLKPTSGHFLLIYNQVVCDKFLSGP